MILLGGSTVIASGDTPPKGGTLGLVVKAATRTSRRAFLTAGHVVGRPGSAVYHAGVHIGTVLTNSFTGANHDPDVTEPDIAVVLIENAVPDDDLRPLQVASWKNRKLSERQLTGFATPAFTNSRQVEIVGALAGSVKMTTRGVTTLEVTSKTKPTHYEVGVVTMSANGTTQPGDSGAPVIYSDKLVGIYAGKIKIGQVVTHYFVPLSQFKNLIRSSW